MAKNDSDNGEHFLDIDQDELDRCLVEQPRLFFKHAKRLADARLALDEAKTNLDIVRADLSLAIRDNPKKYKLEKITEASVEATLLTTKPFKEAQDHVNSCSHDVAVLQAVVTALDHRKRALEKLVDLHGQSYFSEPRVKGEEANASLERERMKAMVKKTRRRERDDE